MTTTSSPILAPVVSLVLWSLIMEAWLYAVRIPAIFRLKIKVRATKEERKRIEEKRDVK
jgi:hypothetical protein